MLKSKSATKAGEPQIEVNAATIVRRTYTKKKKTETETDVPPILLEGDAPVTAPASGPGEKFSLGAIPPAQSFSGGELPESYGTRKLFLTARDPHWLYAHWDLTRPQQLELNGASTDGHLVLRICAGKIGGRPSCLRNSRSPESRHWFAHMSNVPAFRTPPSWAIIRHSENGPAWRFPAAR